MKNKKTGLPFPSGNPAIRLRADPQFSVSRLLGIWLYHGMIKTAFTRDLPAPRRLYFIALANSHPQRVEQK
jgi:hypothetical protein